MRSTRLRTLWPRLILFIILLLPGFIRQGWTQPGGFGRGGMGGMMGGGGMGGPGGERGGPGGPGGGQARHAPPRFDMSKATTITGQVVSLGSYGRGSWRSLPGLAVQGLTLRTGQGDIEVYLGPPSFAREQNFTLQPGDTLEVTGFKVAHEDKPAFFAAKVKGNHQTLTLLDENSAPLWKEQESGRQDSGRGGRGERDPSQPWGETMGTRGMGWER